LGLFVDKFSVEIKAAYCDVTPATGGLRVQMTGCNELQSFGILERYVLKQLADITSLLPQEDVASSFYPHLQDLNIPHSWASEGSFPGGTTRGFFPTFFKEGAKSGEICFFPTRN